MDFSRRNQQTLHIILGRSLAKGLIVWLVCAAYLIPVAYIQNAVGAWTFQTL